MCVSADGEGVTMDVAPSGWRWHGKRRGDNNGRLERLLLRLSLSNGRGSRRMRVDAYCWCGGWERNSGVLWRLSD